MAWEGPGRMRLEIAWCFAQRTRIQSCHPRGHKGEGRQRTWYIKPRYSRHSYDIGSAEAEGQNASRAKMSWHHSNGVSFDKK